MKPFRVTYRWLGEQVGISTSMACMIASGLRPSSKHRIKLVELIQKHGAPRKRKRGGYKEQLRLEDRLVRFRVDRDELVDFKADRFPPGTVVYVVCDEYSGFGLVGSEAAQPDKLPVSAEDGSTVLYNLDKCHSAVEPAAWPQWCRKAA